MSNSYHTPPAASHPDGITMLPIERYKPSGAIGLASVPMGLLFGIAVAVGGGILYNMLMNITPLLYINAVLTLVYGLVIGMATGLGLRLGKCRNTGIAVIVGLICGCVGFIVPMTVEFEDLDHFNEVLDEGWEIGLFLGSRFAESGISISGLFAFGLFVVQFVAILVICGVLAYLMSSGTPYCENCRRFTSSKTLGSIYDVDEAQIKQAVEDNNLLPLIRVPRLPGSGKRLDYALFACPSCGREKHLSLELKWKELKGKKEEEASCKVIDNLIISDQFLDELTGSEGFIRVFIRVKMSKPIIRSVGSRGEFEGVMEEYRGQGFELLSQGERQALFRKKQWGSIPIHIVLILFTWGLGNLIYWYFAKNRAEQVLVKVGEESS